MELQLPPIESEQITAGLEPYIDEFIADRSEEILKLRCFLESGDFESIMKCAHNWAGFSKPYGFNSLGVIGDALEEAARKGSDVECRVLIAEVVDYLQRKKASVGLL